MIKLVQRIVLAIIVVATSMLWVEPAVRQALGYQLSKPTTTIAQRYPLRARSSNFANRSKISYTRGK